MANKLVEKDNSKIQHRALKLRIYPTKEQEILINKTFGCVRKRYNIYLDENKQFYEKVIKLEENLEKCKELWKALHLSTEKELRDKFPYMKEVSAQALCSAQMDARKAFFNSLSGKKIGLDFSPAELYIDGNGNSGKDLGYTPQKQKYSRKLKLLKRKLAKKQKGSNNQEKAGIKVARIENHIGNTRLDFIEKETLWLVRNYEIIGVENLNLQGISGFLRNAKNMVDTSWGTFVGKLEWKASKNEHNCQVIKVSRHFPSSQLCSKCGFQNKGLKLSQRKRVCPSCGIEHDRDFNAATNIKGESIRLARS